MPIHNADVSRVLDSMADLLEIQGANPFRVRAYRNASRVVGETGRDIAEMVREGDDLTRLPGIGRDLAQKIREIISTGHLSALDTLETTLPPSLLDLRKIPGLGPKRVQTLYRTLGVRSIQDLEKSLKSGRLRTLSGFGEGIERKIRKALSLHVRADHRFRIDRAEEYAGSLVKTLSAVPGVTRVEMAGSFRRRKETVGDLDILVTAGPRSPVMDRFTGYEEVQEVVSQGETRSTVILKSGLQVDLRVVPDISYGAALHYFTGSKPHNIALRGRARSRGWKINEYGVFEGKKRMAGETEESVYGVLGLPWIPPELRENQGEIEAAEEGRLPVLIELSDLRGDLHCHTSLTDGQNTLEETVKAGRERGFDYLAVTDHSHRLGMTHGLDEKGLMAQLSAIDALRKSLKGITLLSGMEVDIQKDGTLDMSEMPLSKLDLVIGAIHSHFDLPREKQTDRILRAMDHPYLTILAHPSGRLIGERPPMDLDWERLIQHARERGTVLEINAQPSRLDLTEIYARMARESGVLLAIDSDSHSRLQFDNLRFGIGQARRAWVSKENVLNTRPLSEVLAVFRKIRLKGQPV